MLEKRVDVSVSLSCVTAYGLWVTSLALWGASLFWMSEPTGRLSLIVCGAAVTATIRTYFLVLGRRIRRAMIVAVTEAVDETRARANVRSVR